MVIAVNVGYVWAFPRLACLRWRMLGTCHDAGGSSGRRGSPRSYCHTLGAAGVVGEGALRGRSPRTREGRIGPTAQLQWSVVSGQ